MDRFCDELLSSTALPGDQDGAVGRAHDLDHFEELLHLFALPNEVPHPVHFLEFAAQVGVLFAKPAVLQRAVNHQLQLFHEVLSLQDVIVCAHLESLNSRFRTGEGRQQDELTIEIRVSKGAQKVDARHVAHLDVGDNQIELRTLCLNETFFGARNGGYRESILFQKNFEQLSNRALIVHNQNLCSFVHYKL